MRGMVRVTALSLVILVGTACWWRDACSGGENMTHPRVDRGLRTSTGGRSVVLRWDGGTGPGAACVGRPGCPVAAVAVLDERALEVHLSADAPQTGALSFALEFPDRRAAIECTHPGMSDHHSLAVELAVDGLRVVGEPSLTQSVYYGGY
jgi:hypothetical protein